MADENTQEKDRRSRYRLIENGRLYGFIEYYAFDGVAIVTHTEVDSSLEGKGHGSRLASEALAFFQAQGRQVVPICGFFASFLRKNPRYAALVTPESRRIFDIGS